jgi:hypothetical protein
VVSAASGPVSQHDNNKHSENKYSENKYSENKHSGTWRQSRTRGSRHKLWHTTADRHRRPAGCGSQSFSSGMMIHSAM